MAATHLKARVLRASPFVALAILVVWTGWDVLRVDLPGWDVTTSILWFLGMAGLLTSVTPWGTWPRRFGILLLGSAYFLAHLVSLGIDLLSAIAFLTLTVVAVELRVLASRFAPIFARSLSAGERSRIDAALLRSLLRLGLAAILAVLVPILAAELALSGALPATTIPTAFLLGAGLLAVVAFLALLPSYRGREVSAPPSEARPAVATGPIRSRASRPLPPSRRWPGLPGRGGRF